MEINFQETVNIADTICSHAQEVRDLETWLNSCVDSTLPSVWQGQGYEGYVDKVKSLKPTFDAMYELIVEIGTGLKNNAIEYEEFDKHMNQQNKQ